MLCHELSPFWPCMVYNAHQIRSGPEKSEIKKLFVRSTVTYHQYELLRQLQTSDDRFRAMSALIGAASPEKMDRNTKVRF